MKNFLIAFLVFLLWSFFAIWLYSWLEPTLIGVAKPVVDSPMEITNTLQEEELPVLDEEKEENDNPTTVIDTTTILQSEVINREDEYNFSGLTSGGEIIFLYPNGISIQKNETQLSIPAAVLDFKYKLNTYAIEHPNEELHILSVYSADENIVNPNLGVQRGNEIKRLIAQTGIQKEKIVVKSIIKTLSFDGDNKYANGINFAFKPLDTERFKAELTKVDMPSNITLYPRYGTNGILVNKELQELMEQLKELTKKNPERIVKVIGHTDNVGNANDNYAEGLTHARQVRWYLVTKGGIDRKKIVALSEGESKAIASNKTQNGRRLNRRIEVIVE